MDRQVLVKVRPRLLGIYSCSNIHITYQDRLEITAQLLFHGIKQIIVLARSEDKFHTAFEDWSHRGGIICGQLHARVQFVHCDLCDITEAQAAVREIVVAALGCTLVPQASTPHQSR